MSVRVLAVDDSVFMHKIIQKVKIAQNAFAATVLQAHNFNRRSKTINNSSLKKIIAIGTSTGGPRALQQLIPSIPGDIPAAFVVVQHMPAGFTKSFAMRLNAMSELKVKEAEDGDVLTAGFVYIAPGDYHMVFKKDIKSDSIMIRLTKGEAMMGHRPSVNVMMNSLSETGAKNIIGIIMTGMGSDGCDGLKNLKMYNNAFIIAQDEQSCVVYGMPKAAINAGVVDIVTPLKEIGSMVTNMTGVL